MRIERRDDGTGYVSLSLQLHAADIDQLIARLRELRSNPTQHFHLSTDPRRDGEPYIDVEVSSQGDGDASNACGSGFAIEPDDKPGR